MSVTSLTFEECADWGLYTAWPPDEQQVRSDIRQYAKTHTCLGRNSLGFELCETPGTCAPGDLAARVFESGHL